MENRYDTSLTDLMRIRYETKRDNLRENGQVLKREMLKLIELIDAGEWEDFTVRRGETALTQHECTAVYFRALTSEEIAAYVATGEPLDKAGAYGYQGLASLFVERIEGDYFNVVGLPLCRLGQMLHAFGINLL